MIQNMYGCIAAAAAERGGRIIGEAPVKRCIGSKDYIPGCEDHAHMFDHPACRALINAYNGYLVNSDRCMFHEPSVNPGTVHQKATSILCVNIDKKKTEIYLHKRCNHGLTIHKKLGGVNKEGKYITRAMHSEEYPPLLSKAIADCIRWKMQAKCMRAETF